MTNTATITHVTTDPTDPDEYGNPGEDTTTTTAFCELQQKQRDEEQTDTAVASETWNLYLVPTAEIDAGDRATVDGVTYEVIGPPWRARHPRSGEITHIEATVRRSSAQHGPDAELSLLLSEAGDLLSMESGGAYVLDGV